MRNLPNVNVRFVKGFAFAFCLFFSFASFAQDNFEWVNTATNKTRYGGVHEGKFIGVDSARNIYVLGSLSGDGDYDPSAGTSILKTTGDKDIFISRYDSSGNYLGATTLEGWTADQISDFAIDSAGNIYICGVWSGFDFDPAPNTSFFPASPYANNTIRGYVAKYTNSGNYIWSDLFVGTYPRCMTLTQNNELVVSGTYGSVVDLNPGPGIANSPFPSSQDVYLLRLDTSGVYLSHACFGGNGSNDVVTDIATLASGKIFVTGKFDGTIDIDPSAASYQLATTGSTDAYIACYTPALAILFGKKIGGTNTDEGRELVAGTNGLIYTTGIYNGTADLDGSAAVLNVTSVGSTDIFITAYDTLGNFSFGKSVGGVNGDDIANIAINNLNEYFISGAFAGSADFDPNGTFTINAASAGDVNIYVAGYTSVGALKFARSIGGTLGEYSYNICVVGNSSVMITGEYEGSVDFDPGPGSQIRTGPYRNAFFAEYSSINGNFLLAKEMGKYRNVLAPDIGRCVTMDAAGNVYTCGEFTDTTDFDIGPAVVNLIQAGVTSNTFIAKYSGAGTLSYALKLGNIGGYVGAFFIDIDNSGNIVVVGEFSGTIDFNPGAGVSNLTSNSGGIDIYMARYTAAGSFISAAAIVNMVSSDQYRDCCMDANDDLYVLCGTGGMIFGKFTLAGATLYTRTLGANGNGIDFDPSGNVVITGSFTSSVDFDPSAATYFLNATSSESMFLAKYDVSGNFIFAYGSDNTWWIRGQKVAVDSLGAIYVTGQYIGTADMDFGPGTLTLSASTSYSSIFLAKYSSTGGFLYAYAFGNNVQSTEVKDIDLWNNTEVIVTAMFADTVDFDASASIARLGATTRHIAAIVRYTTGGVFVDALRPAESTRSNVVYSTHVVSSGEFLMTGYYEYRADFDPSPNSFILNASNHGEYFVGKYRECNALSITASSTPTCSGDSTGTVSVNATGSGITYNWLTIGNTTPTVSALPVGTYSCVVTDACGTDDTVSIAVISHTPLLSTTTQTDVDCNGNQTGSAIISVSGGAAPFTYVWSSPNGNDSLLSAVGANSYSCTITDANSCEITATVTITQPAPLSTAVLATDPTTCISNDGGITLTVSGGTPQYMFLWSTSDTSSQLNGLQPGSYQCQITDQNGCSFTIYDTLYAQSGNPVVTLAVVPAMICSTAASIVLTGGSPSGGTWSGSFMTDSTFYPGLSGLGMFAVTYTFTDANGCSSAVTDSVLVDPCLGVSESSYSTIQVFPNPASDLLVVTSELTGMVEITNAIGERIVTANVRSGITEISVTGLAEGVYYLHFTSETQYSVIQPLIIAR